MLIPVPMSIFTMYESDDKNGFMEYDLSKSPDDAWWSYKPLNYLDLSSNVLDKLPENIKIFEDLTVLNVSCLSIYVYIYNSIK